METKYAVSKDGAKIAYNVAGEGYPLMLVHGIESFKEKWIERGWIDVLKKHFTVMSIDLRGHGQSDKSYDPEFYSIDNIINDIDAVANACGFEEYNYFGHSYGANIGFQLCKYNKNIKKMVCSGNAFGDEFFKEILPAWIKRYENLSLNKKNNTLDKLDLSKEDVEWAKNIDLELFIAQFNGIKKWKGTEISDLSHMKTELAIFSGTKDHPFVINNLEDNRDEIEKNGIKLKIYDGLTHMDLVDKINVVSPWVLENLL